MFAPCTSKTSRSRAAARPVTSRVGTLHPRAAPMLYRSADALDPSGSSRDLADGIYGELFGAPCSGISTDAAASRPG